MTDNNSKIGLQDFQEMLRKRKAPAPSKRSAYGDSKFTNSEPEWKIVQGLRRAYFKAPEDVPTRIRVIPNNNGELFYEYHQAWVKRDGRNNSIISNAWNGERPLPCLLYDKYAAAYEDGGYEAAQDFKSSPQFAMTVVVLEDFYEVVKQGKREPYTVYVQAPAPNRHGHVVDEPEYAGCAKSFGRVQHWSMYGKQKEAFEKSLSAALKNCASCKEGRVEAVAFSCSNCKDVFGDVRKENIPQGELDFLRSGKGIQCGECSETNPPVVETECVVQRGYGSSAHFEKGCEDPRLIEAGRPVDLVIKRVRAGNSWAVEILDVEVPANYEKLAETQVGPSVRTDLPLEFDRFFGRMSLRDQAFMLGVDNPYGPDCEDVIDKFFEAAPNQEDADSIPF